MSGSSVSRCVHGAQLRGVEALPVTVQVSMAQGIPGMTIVGLPDASLLEARHRVRSALRAAGFSMPRLHVTVNLHPSEIRKTGTGYDLPIAVGILACTGQIPISGLDGCLFCGELGLEGEVSAVRGMVAFWQLARRDHLTLVSARTGVCSASDPDAPIAIGSLGDLMRDVRELPHDAVTPAAHPEAVPEVDFSDVIDQEMTKRHSQGVTDRYTSEHNC